MSPDRRHACGPTLNVLAAKHPRLTREEERELWYRLHDHHDQRAGELLVEANLRFVVAIALKYRRYGLPLTDLIAEGNLGIMHALTKFEPERGNRFVTYAAYWIRALILNFIIQSLSLVGAGSGALRSKMFFKLRREHARITNLVGDSDRAEEMLAAQFNVSRPRLVEMLGRLDARDLSLDAPAYGDDSVSRIETLISPDTNQEDACANNQHERRLNPIIRAALDALDKRERWIVEHRLMADEEDVQSLAELGRRLGVSRERARQLEARAKMKLKRIVVELSGNEGPAGLLAESAA